MYFSLQYLSLSDAEVLKFLAPILTGFSGVLFLKESLSLKEVAAGREHFMKCLTSTAIYVIQYGVFVELSSLPGLRFFSVPRRRTHLRRSLHRGKE
jgi:hypothetical protein